MQPDIEEIQARNQIHTYLHSLCQQTNTELRNQQ